jgi:hypothetical protein
MLEMAPGATQAKSTISISMIGSGTAGSENSANEHPYFHISNAGLSIGTGFIRMTNVGGTPYSTIRVAANQEADAAFKLPHRSGSIPIAGTFVVDLEAIAAETLYSTNVVVAGFRTEDAIVCSIQNSQATFGTRGYVYIAGARPSNSGIAMSFFNAGATTTVAGQISVAYVTVR